jgi:Zn-dependent protease/CBS domain-containing protein
MRVARILDIDVTVDYTWLFVVALVFWSLSGDIGPLRRLELSPSQCVVLGTVGAVLLFASVLVHEFAHAMAARAQGLRVRGVTLFLVGGASHIDGEAANPGRSASIALVGPLASFALAAAFYGAAHVRGVSAPLATALACLALANCSLGLFNLLPAYPLDGGRILHSLIWRLTADRDRATIASATVGTVLAWILIGYGIYELFPGGLGGGPCVAFIGWFLLGAAKAEQTKARLAEALRGRLLRDFAVAPSPSVRANTTVAEATAAMMRTERRTLPVTLGEQLIGLVGVADLAKVCVDEIETTYVTAVMTRDHALVSVTPTSSALDAFELMNRRGLDELPIVDERGALVGLLTRESLFCRLPRRRTRVSASTPEPDHGGGRSGSR